MLAQMQFFNLACSFKVAEKTLHNKIYSIFALNEVFNASNISDAPDVYLQSVMIESTAA